MTKTVLMNEN